MQGPKNRSRRIGPAGIAAAMIALAVVVLPAPAAAQGLFDFLFGTLRRALPAPPPPSQSYADPNDTAPDHERPTAYGPAKSYCVRTCDGYGFPISRHANVSPVEACRAFCPASTTKVFSGGDVAHSIAHDGTRYADLPNAFVYRDKMVNGCTCNGKDAYGVARIDPNGDPTLRPGDIVATEDGLASYRGERNGQALFTPIDKSAVLGGKRLSSIKVQDR